MEKEVRVRYSPSPSGFQHIGGVRTVLFNYFFAKSMNGKFIVRVEDTDQTRCEKKYEDDLWNTLDFLGIKEDESSRIGGEFAPYTQSKRTELYRKYVQILLDKDEAYKCYCSEDTLKELRETNNGYDGRCSRLSQIEKIAHEQAKTPYVIRLKIDRTQKTTWQDEVMGEISWNNKDVMPDPILMKQDGFPTYHLANVIDDHLMEITHVMRAQEWIPSTPVHLAMYKAFGWTPPIYMHLPMVMGNDNKKLSKRHGDTSLKDFVKAGYIKEAIINYVSMVGWALDGETEMFSKLDLEKVFKDGKINVSSGIFDYKKLKWFNGQYIRKMSNENLADLLLPILKTQDWFDEDKYDFTFIIDLVKERLALTTDVIEMVKFLYVDELNYNIETLVPKKTTIKETKIILTNLIEIIKGDNFELGIDSYMDYSGFKKGQLLMPLRIALTGTKKSPDLVSLMKLLNEEIKVSRIKDAIKILNK